MPDADMPVDENGVRADIVIIPSSASNRMNVARGHEQLIGAAGRDCIKDIRTMFGLDELKEYGFETAFNTVTKASEKLQDKAFKHLKGMYKVASPTRVYPKAQKMFENKEDGWWLEHLAQVIVDGNEPYGLFLQNPIGCGIEYDKVVDELSTGKYAPRMTVVTYRDLQGKLVTTKTPFLIGPNYYLGLEKTATDHNGVSVSRKNQFGISSKLTNSDKYLAPVRETGTKHVGETEYRNIAKSVGGEMVSLMSDLHNDPATVKQAATNLLEAVQPTNMDVILDPKVYSGRHRVRDFTMQHMYTSGKRFVRPDDNKP